MLSKENLISIIKTGGACGGLCSVGDCYDCKVNISIFNYIDGDVMKQKLQKAIDIFIDEYSVAELFEELL